MAVSRVGVPLESGAVRVRGSGGTVGAGFLIAPDVVCTCAHVVADALGVRRDLAQAPDGTVLIDFPLLRDTDGTIPVTSAEVVSWQPVAEDDSGDVALLRLQRPVVAARPVPLVDGSSVWGHAFRVYGFPEGAEHGVWVAGTLRASQGAGWLQVDAAPEGTRIQAGFSGAAVWDDTQGGVVGMTVAVGHGTLAGTAYLLPSAALVDEDVIRPRCPFRGLSAFGEDDSQYFHGRREDVERLEDAVDRHPVTIVAGPSGCGKSSLVRAGLLPRSRARGTVFSYLRPVPGIRPWTALAQALIPVLEPEAGEVDRLRKAGELAGVLEESVRDGVREETAVGLRAALRRRCGRGGHLLFVDQLEEYASTDPAAARTLFGLLATVVATPGEELGGRIRVVVTARAESLDALVTPETSGLLSDAVLFIAPLSPDGLYEAVTRPVDAVAGLWLEPGLAERIVQDAADEPGRMPLMQFTLTRLWERRDRAMLTHAVYQELGGVAGALVEYAEETYRAQVSASGEHVARRLFVQLARPNDRGGFTRSPTPVSSLDPAALAIARTLASRKLVVFGRTPEGTEIIDLAHEALTRLWPRLRDWLEDSREFRAWQEQVRRDMARWKSRGAEPGGLLHGRLLADAEDWLARRPEDVTADERAYIDTSRRHQRRGVRRWQTAAAALIVLLLTATTLGVVAMRNQHKVEDQLRALASRTLAEESDQQSDRAPGAALQLALAAWHTEPTPQARSALLRQYTRAQYLRSSLTGLWRGTPQHMDATPDGRSLVMRSQPLNGGPQESTVVTAALTGHPHHYTLRGTPHEPQASAISPDGRHYAVATSDGSVLLWELDGTSSTPTTLAKTGPGNPLKRIARLHFSADGHRLLRLLDFNGASTGPGGRQGALAAWEVVTHRPLSVAADVLPPGGSVEDAAFAQDPDTVVFAVHQKDGEEALVRRLRTGKTVRRISRPGAQGMSVPQGNGAYVIEEEPEPSAQMWVHDLASGARSRLPVHHALPDATGAYMYVWDSDEDGGYSEIALARLPSGDSYRTRIPHLALDEDLIAAVPRGGDAVTVLAAVGDTLVSADTQHSTVFDADSAGGNPVLSPDGRRLAGLSSTRLQVTDLASGTRHSAALPRADPRWTFRAAWARPANRLVVWQQGGAQVSVYDAGKLSERVDVQLDVGIDTGKEIGGIGAVAPLEGGDAAVLTVGGALLRIDLARGTQIGPPLQRKDRADLYVDDPQTGQLLARPGHPHQVAVMTGKGAVEGTVQLWDVRARERLAVLSGEQLAPVNLGVADFDSSLAFSPDGRELMTERRDGYVQGWDVEKRRVKGPRIAVDKLSELLGTDDAGVVLTYSSALGIVTLWDATTGDHIGDIGLIIGTEPAAMVRDNRLTVFGNDWYQSFDLHPDMWFKSLCKGGGRAYTGEERKHLLPPGTPLGNPCAGSRS